MDEREDGRRVRRTYDEAFNREAVRLVVEGGCSFKTAAKSLGMSEQSLRTWHAKLVPAPPPCGEIASLAELNEEIARLRRQLKRAEMEREILPLDRSTLFRPTALIRRWDAQERPPSPRAQRRERIDASVRRVHADSHGVYGSGKVAKKLAQEEGLERACRNTVARAMREMGLKSRVSKGFKPTTTQADPSKQAAPNLLDRDFDATRPNQKWVTDITYLKTGLRWVYLAVVLDLFSRKVVGWSMSESLATPLVSDALRRAIESRRPVGEGLLLHSDRGCQYTSDAYQKTLRGLNVTCSMSRSGECYDNAVAERFFWSLKHEWANHESYADLEAARLSVFKYIETFYNRERLHQALGYKSPDQFETEYAPVLAA